MHTHVPRYLPNVFPLLWIPICMLSLQADDEASKGVKDEGLPSENS